VGEDSLPTTRAACVLVQELLPLYVDNEVAPDTRAWITEHLKVCPDCQAAALDLTQDILDATAPIKALSDPLPPTGGKPARAGRWPVMTWWAWTAFVAAAAGTFFVTMILWR